MAREVKLSQKRLRDLVADVSHQLRTPLTSIRGFTRAIIDGTAQSKNGRIKAARIIEDESRRMMRQVDGLLELSQMQLGQAKLEREPLNIEELIGYCLETFAVRAEEKNISLESRVEAMSPVIGDADHIEQVFNNLLENAIKNTPTGGRVKITGRQADSGWVEVTVADNGAGIAAEQLPHVFERFYQVNGADTGSGLGLAIALEIVRAHGGDIKVSSTVGKGTEFIVRLPQGNTPD
jgi:signal transduction histidine kinase